MNLKKSSLREKITEVVDKHIFIEDPRFHYMEKADEENLVFDLIVLIKSQAHEWVGERIDMAQAGKKEKEFKGSTPGSWDKNKKYYVRGYNRKVQEIHSRIEEEI